MYHDMFSPTVGIQLLKTLNEDGSNLQMINDRLFVCLFLTVIKWNSMLSCSKMFFLYMQ